MLIIQTAFIGDVVLATPLIEVLADEFPDAQIDFLLRKGNENLLADNPRLNQVLIWDKKVQKTKNLLKILRGIRKERYDLLINLQRFASTGLITMLSKAKMKVGFSKNPFSFSFDTRVDHRIGDGTHEVQRNLRLVEKWVVDKEAKPKLYLSQETMTSVQTFKNKPYITLAPTSVWFTKQLPKENWIAFLKELRFDGEVYLLGGPDDHEACEQIIAEGGRGENLCGKLSLLESAALMKDAKMNYVNDSAPMHFASAVNAPTCAVFCSTLPAFGFGPLADNAHVIEIESELNCRPCGLHGKKACPEGHFKCGHEVSTDRMAQLLESW